jgi:hypothetical protein
MGICKICEKDRQDRELMDGKIVFEGTTIYGVCVDCQLLWRGYLIKQIKALIEYAQDKPKEEKKKRGRPKKEVN